MATTPRLNKVLPREHAERERAKGTWAKLRNLTGGKEAIAFFQGQVRTYQPLDPNDENTLPDDETRVRAKADEVLAGLGGDLTALYDVTATKDWANTYAKHSVELDGKVFIENAPTPYLLWLEDQLPEVLKFVQGLPLRDESEAWSEKPDPATGLYSTAVMKQVRTDMRPEKLDLAPATKEHQATTHVYTKNVVIGHFTTRKFTGAITPVVKKAIEDRIRALITAVRAAREEANMVEAPEKKVGERIFNYILKGEIIS